MDVVKEQFEPFVQDPASVGRSGNGVPGVRYQTSMTRDRLYEQFTPLVERLIRQYGTNADLRQDLPGEIYYRFRAILEAFDSTRGVPFRPYIVRQLTASVFTYARKRWLVQTREVALEPMESHDISPAIDPTPQWVETLSDQQTMALLPDAVAKLPVRQRQVLVWHYYDERSFAEIAEIFNIEAATVRSLLRHGLNKLRKSIVPTKCEDA